jgi:hypothetical protein
VARLDQCWCGKAKLRVRPFGRKVLGQIGLEEAERPGSIALPFPTKSASASDTDRVRQSVLFRLRTVPRRRVGQPPDVDGTLVAADAHGPTVWPKTDIKDVGSVGAST